ncbi:MAG: type II toxin-antitoxin system RelE/ParE family toxin [Bacteroidetes bacterium]|nr:type II toxin-antitoxin system RelE/ParE family toxin [Bacteroidota bacterium]
MNYSVIPSEKFKREAKRLIKKFPSLKQELSDLSSLLEIEPARGTPLGNNTFKIRVSVKSKGKGKSGGARVITYVVTDDKEIYLLTIYDKSEFDNIDDRILKAIIKGLISDK